MSSHCQVRDPMKLVVTLLVFISFPSKKKQNGNGGFRFAALGRPAICSLRF